MSLQKLGLRYERLLILSAPISAACILVAFISTSSDVGRHKRDAACHTQAAKLIDDNLDDLQAKWNKREKIGKYEFAIPYAHKISTDRIYGMETYCYSKVEDVPAQFSPSPADLSKSLKEKAESLIRDGESKPIVFHGVQIPNKTTISLAGIPVNTDVTTIVAALQIILLPILMLWLGSLYSTRYRETILIESAKKISELHPHIINIYIDGKITDPRRRSWTQYYLNIFSKHIPLAIRITILSIFILPPTGFYCLSLFYTGLIEINWPAIFAGFVAATFTLMNIVNEAQPWHAGKTFPGPTALNSYHK